MKKDSNNKQNLTEKQQFILDDIQNYIEQHEYSPTFREISERTGYRSINSVMPHINALVKKGYIVKTKHISRSIRLLRQNESVNISSVGLQNGMMCPVPEVPMKRVQALRIAYKNSNFFFVMDDSFQPYHNGDILIVRVRKTPPLGKTFFYWKCTQNQNRMISLATSTCPLPSDASPDIYAECLAVIRLADEDVR
jgi:repressor LexA